MWDKQEGCDKMDQGSRLWLRWASHVCQGQLRDNWPRAILVGPRMATCRRKLHCSAPFQALKPLKGTLVLRNTLTCVLDFLVVKRGFESRRSGLTWMCFPWSQGDKFWWVAPGAAGCWLSLKLLQMKVKVFITNIVNSVWVSSENVCHILVYAIGT